MESTKRILARRSGGRKRLELLYISHPDLRCPRPMCPGYCRVPAAFLWIECSTCGWFTLLLPEEHAELISAVAGIIQIDLPLYLACLRLHTDFPSAPCAPSADDDGTMAIEQLVESDCANRGPCFIAEGVH